jgi:hypothetical protein
MRRQGQVAADFVLGKAQLFEFVVLSHHILYIGHLLLIH